MLPCLNEKSKEVYFVFLAVANSEGVLLYNYSEQMIGTKERW